MKSLSVTLADRIALEPRSGAWMSDEDIPMYRYALWRIWDQSKPLLLVGMLNPSTADHRKNDPTITRVISFAKANGYGGIIVINAYAFRATDPAEMFRADDPDGPMNRLVIAQASALCQSAMVGYGAKAGAGGNVLSNRLGQFAVVFCLGVTKDGHPRHPLYVPSSQPFVPFQYRSVA